MLLQKIFQCIVGAFINNIDILCDLLTFSLYYLASIPPVKGFSVNEDYYRL